MNPYTLALDHIQKNSIRTECKQLIEKLLIDYFSQAFQNPQDHIWALLDKILTNNKWG